MYSLRGSLVIMRDLKAGAFRIVSSLGTKQACVLFKNSLHVFQLCVCLSHVLHLLSATRPFLLNVSTCKVVCRRHDVPTNGPTGDPSMVRLP